MYPGVTDLVGKKTRPIGQVSFISTTNNAALLVE
jgi:hypothetical protein